MMSDKIKDLLIKYIIIILSIIALIPIISITLSLITRGLPVILHSGTRFFTQTAPSPGAETYGIGPAIAGTIVLGILASLIGIPLALLAAILIVSFPNSKLSKIVSVSAKSLMEIPTVLVGMLVYATIVIPMGRFSLLAGAIALALVMLPYVLTYVEEAMRQVPYKYIEAGYGIGMNKMQVAFKVVIGVAKRGIVMGILIGITKALGETAPLLFTVGAARNSINWNPLQPGDAIPLLIFNYVQTPYQNLQSIAWGAAFLLFAIFISIYMIAKVVVGKVRI